jgi:hypothetical protein
VVGATRARFLDGCTTAKREQGRTGASWLLPLLPRRLGGHERVAKTKLTPERQEIIVGALEAGNYDEVAAQAAGISKASFYNWLNRGQAELERVEAAPNAKVRQGEQPLIDFFDVVTRAKAQAEPEMVARIRELGERDWRALAWMLERRFSGRWAKRQRLEVLVEREFEAMLGFLEENLEPEEYRKVVRLLASVGAEG